ncbi:MAG TPA: hypothetical protein DDZ51_28915 [Planctomycetaceae bacterium]|nr:hypothetical protein [Planctomycetaceae bacterium]
MKQTEGSKVSNHLTETRQRRGYSIAIGLFAPAVIWFLHLFTLSVVAEWGDFSNLNHRRFLTISVVSWIIFSVSLVAISATILSIIHVAHFEDHLHRTLENHKAPNRPDEFLERVAIYSGLIFLAITFAQTLPILFFVGGG